MAIAARKLLTSSGVLRDAFYQSRFFTCPESRIRIMAKYGKKAQSSVKKTMHKKKKGTLKSGKSGKKVTSNKQAIAIGLSEARKKGAKVPAKK
jgi:hypothetical protein